ncbi:hypothetical protein [Mesorhizobium sp. M0276]|uniref:hypothetical protein n=1 Tax=Mesorhizobium sp. M0276 TaxID=2956928 RepID=UPI003335EE1E
MLDEAAAALTLSQSTIRRLIRALSRQNNIAKAHPGSFDTPTLSERRYAGRPTYAAHDARHPTSASQIY